jgi:hypothetical protein
MVVHDNPATIGVAVDPLAALPFREVETVLLQSANEAAGGDAPEQAGR